MAGFGSWSPRMRSTASRTGAIFGSSPIGPLHWAGAETATVWNGYMDGAVGLGRRCGRGGAGELPDQPRGGTPFSRRILSIA
jgi:hypothetical protein